MSFDTEFEFVLPKGFMDASGTVHRIGRMRLAKAMDEILPLRDPRVQANPAYLVIILMSRVITALGDLAMPLKTNMIEEFFAVDMAYSQEFYNRINGTGSRVMEVTCPHCGKAFDVEPEKQGEF